jgi:hypothetical protein
VSYPHPIPTQVLDAGGNRTGVPTLAVWGRIVLELASLQDASAPESAGLVVNPILGAPFVVDTCCAAAVFAAEYQRTGEDRWQRRALDALSAAPLGLLFQGVDEPEWNGRGWRDAPESLPATAIALDAYLEALSRLELDPDLDRLDDLRGLLSRCRTVTAGFAHNPTSAERSPREVQNAGASVLYLADQLSRVKDAQRRSLDLELRKTRQRLRRGQLASGFWPYGYPRYRARMKEGYRKEPLRTLLGREEQAVHGRHGDIMHHLMTLYYLAGSESTSGSSRAANGVLTSGWSWIRKRLIKNGDRGLSIDWRGDPAHGNTRDTNAYFLIFGMMPHLVSTGILSGDESTSLTTALLMHIELNLLGAATPCIRPYEGPREIVQNILPMFEQSTAWKGRLMSGALSAAGVADRSSAGSDEGAVLPGEVVGEAES